MYVEQSAFPNTQDPNDYQNEFLNHLHIGNESNCGQKSKSQSSCCKSPTLLPSPSTCWLWCTPASSNNMAPSAGKARGLSTPLTPFSTAGGGEALLCGWDEEDEADTCLLSSSRSSSRMML